MQPCESGLFTQHNAFLIKHSLMMYEMLLYNFALVFFLFQNVLISSPTLVSDKQNVFWLRNDYSYSFKYQRRAKQIPSKCPGESKIEKTSQLSLPTPYLVSHCLAFCLQKSICMESLLLIVTFASLKKKGNSCYPEGVEGINVVPGQLAVCAFLGRKQQVTNFLLFIFVSI